MKQGDSAALFDITKLQLALSLAAKQYHAWRCLTGRTAEYWVSPSSLRSKQKALKWLEASGHRSENTCLAATSKFCDSAVLPAAARSTCPMPCCREASCVSKLLVPDTTPREGMASPMGSHSEQSSDARRSCKQAETSENMVHVWFREVLLAKGFAGRTVVVLANRSTL